MRKVGFHLKFILYFKDGSLQRNYQERAFAFANFEQAFEVEFNFALYNLCSCLYQSTYSVHCKNLITFRINESVDLQ